MSLTRCIRTVPLAAILGLLCFGLTLAATDRASAAETPFKVEFDTSELQVNVLDNLPLDSLSTKATIEGTISETGALKIPAGGFKMPELGITDPVTIKGFMGIEGPATGTFDEKTGQMVINGKAGIWLSVNLKQLLAAAEGFVDLSSLPPVVTTALGLAPNLTCGFSPMDIEFSTEPNSLKQGARFTEGLEGPGALSAEWSQLGPFAGRTKILGFVDLCQLLKEQLPSLIGGLGGGTDLGGIDLGGLLEDLDLTQLDNLNLGPSAITLTRTTKAPDPPVADPPVVDPPAKPARLKLSVTPRKRKAKAGTKVRYRVAVKNTGGRTSKRVKVCVNTPKKAIRTIRRCRVLGIIKPGKTKRGAFKVKLKKHAAKRGYRIKFRVRSGAAAKPKSSARLRIR